MGVGGAVDAEMLPTAQENSRLGATILLVVSLYQYNLLLTKKLISNLC